MSNIKLALNKYLIMNAYMESLVKEYELASTKKKSPVFKMRLIYFNLYGRQYFQNIFTDNCLTCPVTFSEFTMVHPFPNTEDTEWLIAGHAVRGAVQAGTKPNSKRLAQCALSTKCKVTCENICWSTCGA